jgi:hypothetical protein
MDRKQFRVVLKEIFLAHALLLVNLSYLDMI